MRIRLFRLLLLVVATPSAAAQVDTVSRISGATVSGVVRDSIARRPLAGAVVQLVAADNLSRFARATSTDSLGRFTLADVPHGQYTLGFFHPMLDSLGLEPTLRAVSVDGHQSVEADLAIPSPARLRIAICGRDSARSSGLRAVVVGVVRDAQDGAPVAGVSVTGEWLELSFRPDGIVRRVPRLVATTRENGWFAMCDVPNAGTMALRASRGRYSTDAIEVQVPEDGFARRELYLGLAPPQNLRDSTLRSETLAQPLAPLALGEGLVRGTVLSAAGGQSLAGAVVGIGGGPQTRANDRGEWTLAGVPAGTRMLEVRAMGYYPDRRAVHVVAGAAPVHVALSTFKAVLDTMKVRAIHLRAADIRSFETRRRSGVGHYLTAQDIARVRPLGTSDLFRRLPGVRLGDVRRPEDYASQKVFVRGNMGDWCPAAIFLNGQHLGDISAGDLDDWMYPNEIAGIEIYSGPGAPLEYQALSSSPTRDASRCGSILIWTKM